MPLLEFDQPVKSNVAKKFSFLDLGIAENAGDIEEIEPERDLLLTKPKEKLPIYIEIIDLKAVSVVKTTLKDGQKLFINLTVLESTAHPLTKLVQPYRKGYLAEVWQSAMLTDVDKKGVSCQVVTVLPLISIEAKFSDEEVNYIVRALQLDGLAIADATKWSTPKMKSKGSLQRISIPDLDPAEHAAKSGQSLITEVEPKKTPHGKHVISAFTGNVLKMPGPSIYTHQCVVPLGGKGSWSIYFDHDDSTLKILIPPAEEFMTVRVTSDDFRAFTRESQLFLFYTG